MWTQKQLLLIPDLLTKIKTILLKDTDTFCVAVLDLDYLAGSESGLFHQICSSHLFEMNIKKTKDYHYSALVQEDLLLCKG